MRSSGDCGTPTQRAAATFALQSLFNVPSAQATAAGGLFFQQQFNVNAFVQSNAAVGLNMFDVRSVPNRPARGVGTGMGVIEQTNTPAGEWPAG